MLKSLIVLMVLLYALFAVPAVPGEIALAPETSASAAGTWNTALPDAPVDTPAEAHSSAGENAPEPEYEPVPAEPAPAPSTPSVPAEPALTDEEAVVGLWRWGLDMADPVNALMTASIPGMEGVYEFYDLVMPVYITLVEDGSFTAVVDSEAVAILRDKFMAQAEEFLVCYLEALIAESGFDMSVEEFMKISGFSMDDMLQSLADEVLSDEMMATIVAEGRGYYKLWDGKISLYSGTWNENVYDLYTLDGDTLTIMKSSGAIAGLMGLNDYTELVSLVYPVVLTRVE